jgi:hypothetical protein
MAFKAVSNGNMGTGCNVRRVFPNNLQQFKNK